MAVLALFGGALLLVVALFVLLMIGNWMPYWAGLAWLRLFDRRPRRQPRWQTCPATPVERRSLTRERFVAWLGNVNNRF